MKLRTKLVVSFSIVVIFVGAIGLTSSYLNDAVKDQVTVESDKAIQEVKLAGELGLLLFKSLTRTQYLVEGSYRERLSMDYSRSHQTEEVQIAEINASLDEFEQSLDQLREVAHHEPSSFFEYSVDSTRVLRLIRNLERKYNNYKSLLEQLQNIEASNYDDRKAFFTITIEPYFRTNILPAIERLRNLIQENHQKQIVQLNSQLDRVGYTLMITTVIALAGAILLAWYIYRSIANPIQKIAEASERIGRGNLKERINYHADDELGQLSETFDKMAENLSKTTVSRDYMDSIIEAMADLLVVTDENFRIIRVNSSTLQVLGKSERKLKGTVARDIFKKAPAELFEATTGSDSKSYTAMLVKEDQSTVPVSISKGVLCDPDGELEGYVFVASDISSEKRAQHKIKESLREKEVLLAEIHHRVKNNLAVISGLLQMQIWETDNEQAAVALQQSQLRVRSIALVHEQLYQSENLSFIEFDTYVEDLLHEISNLYLDEDSNIEINTDLQRVVLNINQAIPCSLLINELVINACKYAFDEGQAGSIKVSLKRSDGLLFVTVKDNGKGFDNAEPDSDFPGITLIHTLAKQLDGDIKFANNDGTEITVAFERENVVIKKNNS